MAVNGHDVGDLCRQTVEYLHRAAAAFVHRGHADAVAEGRAAAAFEGRDAFYERAGSDAETSTFDQSSAELPSASSAAVSAEVNFLNGVIDCGVI